MPMQNENADNKAKTNFYNRIVSPFTVFSKT